MKPRESFSGFYRVIKWVPEKIKLLIWQRFGDIKVRTLLRENTACEFFKVDLPDSFRLIYIYI